MVTIQKNVELAPYTSFGLGGPAEFFVEVKDSQELEAALKGSQEQKIHVLGHGTNTLISDEGLSGLTILIKGGRIQQKENTFVVDAGVWWDDFVQESIAANFWGVELLSGVPGGVGAAVFINIAAYGQSLSDTILWVDVFDLDTGQIKQLKQSELSWNYKKSIFQDPENNFIILRAAFQLAKSPTQKLSYQSALDVAEEKGWDISTLEGRRQTILEARERAGSIYEPDRGDKKTVGSFFRNPVVTEAQAEKIIKSDETGKTAETIKKMNKVHGGDSLRVSAAHVMLAAGFKRGQCFGDVCFHEKTVLKIENKGNASAQDIYNVAKMVMKTCKEKLDVELVPEARILGNFS